MTLNGRIGTALVLACVVAAQPVSADMPTAAEMRIVERVATGTAQRTLARDLNGERRVLAPEDFAPGLKNFRRMHSVVAPQAS